MKRRILLFTISFLLIYLYTCHSASSAVIYDNGAPDQINGFNITSGKWICADDFTLSQNSVITDVHFWAVYTPGSTYNGINWFIYNDSSQQPGSVVDSGSAINIVETPTGKTLSGNPAFSEYRYSFDLGKSLALDPGHYWIGLLFDAPTTESLYWETTSATPNGFHFLMDNLTDPAGWFVHPQDAAGLAFQLTSTSVPEPSTMLLLGSGLAGLFGCGRRRQKKLPACRWLTRRVNPHPETRLRRAP